MTTQKRYEILRNELNEQQWRLYLGTEALTIGYGVISQVAALSGADWKTVQRGVKGLKGEQLRAQGKIQQVGGGRKEEQLTITLAHYAPATSKWNKIEHRLFSFISLIVRRMADFHFHQATSWEEMERIHRKWVRDYNGSVALCVIPTPVFSSMLY